MSECSGAHGHAGEDERCYAIRLSKDFGETARERDLEEIYTYIAQTDSPENAEYVIADGRRDMQSLPSRRLLG